MSTFPTSVAIFGASGNLGSAIVPALLATKKHKVTAIARSESRATLPAAVDVIKGDLTSSQFLKKSLAGHDVVIIALGLEASPDLDKTIVTAAAEAGVKYILPNEFVSQDSLRKHYPWGLHEKKQKIRDLIQSLGKSKWIAIVNGAWYDFSLAAGQYSIDIKKRRATIWTPSTAKANATTLPQVGRTIAALLSLEEEQLKQYANGCVYASSFRVSQLEILQSVQRATGTDSTNWDVSYEDVHEAIKDGNEKASEGSVEGWIKVIYAMQFQHGAGGDYEATNGTANKALGLEEEDLDTVTKAVVAKQ